MFSTDKLGWEELITGISGRLIQGDLGRKAVGISTDTRTLRPGDLFVALKGPRFDGHHYIPQAFEKGASAVLVSEPVKGLLPEQVVIQVNDTLSALGDLSGLWRRKFPVTLIGISGSNGKTTTKEMLAAILGQVGPTLKNPGNLNNTIGLPLSLFSLNEGHRFAVMEMGMNHLGEIARLCWIAKPSVGLLTNIGPAHLEGLGSLSMVAKAKGELFEALESDHLAVVNYDDPRIRDLAESCRAQKITFGLNPEAEVRADQLIVTPHGIRFQIFVKGEQAEILLPIQGEHNTSNALGAAATALALGLSLEKVRQGLEGFKPPEHRLEIKKGIKGAWLIDDTYNANPASLKAALKAFESLKQGKRGGLVLGDMLELGDQTLEAHRELGRMIGEMGVEYLVTLGPFSLELLSEALKGFRPPRKTFGTQSQKEIIDYLVNLIQEGDHLLFKGSHGMDMEAVVRALEDQG
ncbi:MAG: UDP-N-acetylmuramoyl-tripeptide--D-alanyl-D-alanine ligase [Deltaproteobacteria bacterium]|nr:UDP-N-acetylmuramoyl-tripeptide--D-alanyl-D-alanine ligase [Deltaproteobacteria bacterium]